MPSSLCLLLLTLLAAGCASTPRATQPLPVWPPPPAEPRVAYVQSISRPADIGDRPSRFGRFVAWVTGADDEQRLVKPFGIALDEDDNLCLTDTGTSSVIFIDRARPHWQQWDHAGDVHFVSPVAIAKRGDTLYVADSGLGGVVAFQTDGTLQFQITNHLQRPVGLVLAGNHLIVADAERHSVLTFDLRGNLVSEFGGRGTDPGKFNYPTHLAMDREGRLLVTDSMNSRIAVFNPDRTYAESFGSAGDAPGFFSRPKGLAVDSHGHVYVVDGNFDNIQTFDLQGRLLLVLGGAGSEPGGFWLPNGIAISRQDEIFITDCYNRRVQMLKYVGPP